MSNISEVIKKRLICETEEDYAKFSASLIPNINNVLGVRLPILRKIAKEISDIDEFLENNNTEFMEEVMLQGMVIGLIKKEPEKILEYVKNFVPKINNWSVCDSFCASLKFVKSNKEVVWDFLQSYFCSNKEFEIRFAYVMLLTYFINEEYIDKCYELIDKFDDERYYAKMSVAWALSICFTKFPQKTFDYLHKSNLSRWTFNKSIQKIRESSKIDKETKNTLKKFVKQ